MAEVGAAVADWCLAGRDQSLEAHEAAVVVRVRHALPPLLDAVVLAATRGVAPRAQPAPAPCPGCGQSTLPHELARKRTIATPCGRLTLARPWYHCAPCGQGFSVVEPVLGAPERARLSAGLHAWLVLLAQGVAPVLSVRDALRPPTTDAATVSRQERGSFTRNAERMDDPTLRRDGLPIGSGGIESAGDHLAGRRRKRSGMRWSDAGGRAMLTLRARLRSGRPLTAAADRQRPFPLRRSA